MLIFGQKYFKFCIPLFKTQQPILPLVYSKEMSSEESEEVAPKPPTGWMEEGCPCKWTECGDNKFCYWGFENRCATTCCNDNDCRPGQSCIPLNEPERTAKGSKIFDKNIECLK